ncbi:MAG: hypothetical protein WBA93_35620 [Microcoleaceae cyanobacterium]
MIDFQWQPVGSKLTRHTSMQSSFPTSRVSEENLPYSQYLAAWLEAKMVTSSLTRPTEGTLSFLLEALQLTFDKQGDPQTVYPLIVENVDLLEPHLIYILRKWAKQTFPYIYENKAVIIAGVLVNFGRIIWALPDGDPDINLEIALACCELALEVYNLDDFPYQWAILHNNIAVIYRNRCYGSSANNLIKSFEHYQQANFVFPGQKFPTKWTDLTGY